MDKVKVEIKLSTYDGTPDNCSDWFFNLEKSLRKMRIMEEDFLLYATTNTVGLAKEAITMLEVKHKEDYSLIKCDLIDMFDVTNSNRFLHQVSILCEQAHTSKYLDR